MPSEDELRRQLRDSEPSRSVSSIDVDAVIRRSRARRAPRVAAVAVVSALAVVGIAVPVSISVASQQTATLSAGSAGSAASAPQSLIGGTSTKRAPAEKINLCGGELSAAASADDGLVLTVQPVDAAASARDIPVTVTLTNTGAQRVAGSLSPFPALTLSRAGVVLWHSNGAVPSLAQEVDLGPGASTTFSSTFEPVICGVSDDARPSFRDGLPDVGPGSYQLSAALDFSPTAADDGASGDAVLVTGPTSLVTLH